MKLATVFDGTRDGRLVVLGRGDSVFALAEGIAPTLQAALDAWDVCELPLLALKARLDSGALEGSPVSEARFLAPLPRAYEWVDGSAFLNHVRLVRKARKAEPPPTLETDPLVYQGGSSYFLAPTAPIPLRDASWGLDFEGEVAVVLGDTPMGTTPETALQHVRLLVLVNDVTLRNLIPDELAKGFGFFQSKPATALGPFAVTPDELGDAWREGRVHLRMRVWRGEELVGDVHGGEMHFSFAQLIAHLCKTRAYTAGTLLGSGTFSNEDRAAGISCLAEARMIETIDTGKPVTPFLQPGERVRIEVRDAAGRSVFGLIDQQVVSA